MDFSAVVVPVTRADKILDQAEPDYVPLSDLDKLNWDACKYPFLRRTRLCVDSRWPVDDPDVDDGAPVGIQIVARKYEEEKFWAIGKVVHELLLKDGYGKGHDI